MARGRVLALVLAAAVALAGCGEGGPVGATPTVPDEDVETLLVQRQRERNPALRVSDARCPEDVAARQGERFLCTVDVEGQAAGFEVTVAEVLGRKVTYELRPVQAVIDVVGVVDFLRSRLEPEWRAARIDCGPNRVRLVEVGGAVECSAFSGTAVRRFRAVVEDRDGTVALAEG